MRLEGWRGAVNRGNAVRIEPRREARVEGPGREEGAGALAGGRLSSDLCGYRPGFGSGLRWTLGGKFFARFAVVSDAPFDDRNLFARGPTENLRLPLWPSMEATLSPPWPERRA